MQAIYGREPAGSAFSLDRPGRTAGLDNPDRAGHARPVVRAVPVGVRQPRRVAKQLSREGLSGKDIAAILHVSAQRISQLLKATDSPARYARTDPAPENARSGQAPRIRGRLQG